MALYCRMPVQHDGILFAVGAQLPDGLPEQQIRQLFAAGAVTEYAQNVPLDPETGALLPGATGHPLVDLASGRAAVDTRSSVVVSAPTTERQKEPEPPKEEPPPAPKPTGDPEWLKASAQASKDVPSSVTASGGQCRGVTESGAQCNRRAGATGYCGAHADQAGKS